MRLILISYIFIYYVSVSDSKNGTLPADTKINNAKIFNGHDAGQTKFPWQVLIKIMVLFT